MLTQLHTAITASLRTLPGVAAVLPYAGAATWQRQSLPSPVLLLALERLTVAPDTGDGTLLASAQWAVFCVLSGAASGPADREAAAWALASAVLVAVRGQTWDLPGVGPALLGAATPAAVVPVDLAEAGLAARVVQWSQPVVLGADEWADLGVPPTTVWLAGQPVVPA
jgi:hypothetical protein